MDFVHLHLHSEYSLLDGACRISEIPAAVKKAGQSAVAITDHGVMYGAVDFYKACKKEGVKPIIGCEIYVAPDSRFKKDKSVYAEYSHLVLLCKNETGYKNLIKIVSKAFTEGFYMKPCADIELLNEHSEGLIALSACLGGYIPQRILANDTDGALEYAKRLNTIFGEGNFYLELQDHGIKDQKYVNSELVKIRDATGIPLVATNDVHYIGKSDAEIQDILMCIQMNKTLKDKKGIAFETTEFYLKDSESMSELFRDFPEAIENTVKIADMCNFDFEFDKLFLPAYTAPDGLSAGEYLEKLCFEGFEKREIAEEKKSAYKERLLYELDVVRRMGYAEYYLIVCDFISYAKNKGIPVGPGRGSGAGSLAAYFLGITDVDPMKYDLLFERFLNPERVSMPDFDVDFCYERREEVIEYVSEKYGRDHVAQIVTFGTMAAKQAIRDVGRVMGLAYSEVDTVSKNIPFALGMTIDRALKENKALTEIYESDLTLRHMIDVAKKLEGMPRHASVHAAGVVITDKPVNEYVPLAANRGSVVTQFTMNTIADLGLLKIDFLGLRYLTVISDAEKMVKKRIPDFDIAKAPIDDAKTYKLISSGKTEGIFQLESGGMRNLLCKLKPESIEDITAAISLYRPGPMDSIPKYLDNRAHPEKIRYAVPELENILKVTNGCIVYQEQVMQIFRLLAGYSYGRADIVRRAMSKKKTEVMAKEKEYFLYGKKHDDGRIECVGALANGVSEKVALELYDDMSEFAKYAFNKSHAACYAFVAYRTAYLKAHYPKEYICALLTSVLDNMNKVALYIQDAKSLGIKVLPPDINKSTAFFDIEGDAVRFGLLGVKNVGRNFISALEKEREKGEFASLEDFLSRMPQGEINKNMLESLIKAGAFDCFGKKRSQLISVYESACEAVAKRNRASVSGQFDMFSALSDSGNSDFSVLHIDYPDIPELDYMEKLTLEREITGIYLSGHPLERFSGTVEKMKAVNTMELYNAANCAEGEVPQIREKDTVTVIGLVSGKKVTSTRDGKRMAFATLEDGFGTVEAILFPKMFETLNVIVESGKVCAVTGELSFKESDEVSESGEVLFEPKILVKKAVMVTEDDKHPLTPFNSAEITESAQPGKTKFTVSFSNKRAESTMNVSAENSQKTNTMPDTDSDGKKLCLYLRLENQSDEKFERVKNLLEIFGYGKVPVFLHFTDTAKTVRLSGHDLAVNNTALALLEDILGKENVKTAYRKI